MISGPRDSGRPSSARTAERSRAFRGEIAVVVVLRDERVGGGIPGDGVDAVADADERGTLGTEYFVKTESSPRFDDLARVGRAHGDHAIREADGPCEGITRAEMGERFGMVGERRQPAEVGGALVAERMDREHCWRRRIQVGERCRGVPVVQVDNGGLEAAGQRRHRG